MRAVIRKSLLEGSVIAPPSKSMAHRLLICAAFAHGQSTITNITYSKDIMATINCLKALGATVACLPTSVVVNGENFLKDINECDANESGSTLRFMIPLALLTNSKVTFKGSKRLLERPLDVYEDLAKKYHFEFVKSENHLVVKGQLQANEYEIDGSISSQFISGLLFALSLLDKESTIKVLEPFESRSYVDLTVDAINQFGGQVEFKGNLLKIKPGCFKPLNIEVEADESNAAFLDCFNLLNGNVKVEGLNLKTKQGDSIYHYYFEQLLEDNCVIDLKDCPDLGPILMALASLLKGAKFVNTRRLAVKECNRSLAMKTELEKLGGKVEIFENEVIVYKTELKPASEDLEGHNDHRIVMSLTTILTCIGGGIKNAQAVEKSFPDYFDKIKALKAEVQLYDC